MRIGLFTDTYLPVANGICYVIEIIRKDLEAAGHDVWVVAPEDFRWHLPEERRVIRFKAIGGIFYKDQFTTFFFPPEQFRRVKALNLDVIIAFTPTVIGGFGAYCAARLNIPYVIQYGTDIEEYAELYKPTAIGGAIGAIPIAPYFLKMSPKECLDFFKGYFTKRDKNLSYYKNITRHVLSALHAHSDAVIATSDKIAQRLDKWPIRQNISVVPTGVDALPADSDYKKYFAKKHGLQSGDEIILYAGRLSIEKNLDLLIRAFRIIGVERPKAKLLLVGDFQYRHNLEQEAKATGLNDRIIFTGQVERHELGAVYGLADVFAFPSITDCQALVLNEAAHAGLPLVWCDTPALNPVLVNGVSGLQAKNEATDLAGKISKILQDDKLKRKLSAGAKKTASSYSEKIQTSKLEKLLAKLVNKKVTELN